MAGYVLQGKNQAGTMVDIPLAAEYDSTGSKIVDKYATKTVASTSANGLMASADKNKLDGVETGALKYAKALKGSSAPAASYQQDGYLWLDTSGSATVLRFWNGSEWEYVGAVWK